MKMHSRWVHFLQRQKVRIMHIMFNFILRFFAGLKYLTRSLWIILYTDKEKNNITQYQLG